MNTKDLMISGGKGGGGKFRSRPDNLRSTDTFEALIGLTSGRIRGLAPGGLQNLMVDDVPIEDGSGNKTLEDFNCLLFPGDPAIIEPVQLQLGGSSGANSVNLPINNSNKGTGTGTPGDYRFGNVPQAGVDYIDIRLVVSQLFRQDKKGVYDATASIEVQLQPSGTSTWINPLIDTVAPTYNRDGMSVGQKIMYAMIDKWVAPTVWKDPSPGLIQITGKTTTAYVKEIRIAVPNTGIYANRTWQVRCRLMERDSYTQDTDEERRTIQWESVAGVSMEPIGTTEEWRGLAYLQVNGKASDQLNGIPTVTGIYDLSMVRVPPSSVWNAETRVYTGGTWDGATEEIKWTQCPAFQLKDLIEDGLSGISALVPGSTLNKWDTLEASKWYAQLVPDGKGGLHPRYTMNYLLDSAQTVTDTVQYVAGAVGSFAWDEGDGNWRLVVEKPENPTALFTRENIVGEYNYSHTDIDSRYNDIIGVFRNEERNYEEDRVRVFDQPHIDNYGRRTTTLALVGCTNRQEALRRIKIRQLTSLYETRQVTFATNRQGNLVQPFSVILVADSDLGDRDKRTTGRIVDISGTRIRVRDSVRLEIGINYELKVTIPNPNYNPDTNVQPTDPNWTKPTITITRTIVNTAGQRGDVYDIYLNSALPAYTPVNAPVAFSAPNLATMPRQYRVLEVEPQGDELVSISAIEIYTAKWDESDNVDESEILAQRPNKTIQPPTIPSSGMFNIRTYQAEFQIKRVLSVTWSRPPSIWVAGFKVEYSLNKGPWMTVTESTQDNYVEIQQPQNGVYDFRITTIDRRKGVSVPLVNSYEVTDTPEDYAPKQTFGNLIDRPSSGAREGEKFTTLDQNPNLTYVWSGGIWIEESNYVTRADQITYLPATPGGPVFKVQELQPRQAGADVTILNTSKDTLAIKDRDAQDVLDTLDINVDSILAQAIRQDNLMEIFDARTFVEGQPVSSKFINFRDSQITANSATESLFMLLGAKSPSGTAFLLNLDTVQSAPGQTLGQRLTEISAQNNGVQASVTTLQQALVTPDGPYSKYVLRVTAGGAIAGMSATANGAVGNLNFIANNVSFTDPNGGNPITPFSISGGVVRATNMEVDRLTVGALTTDMVGLNQITQKKYWQANYQPGVGGDALTNNIDASFQLFGLTGDKAFVTLSNMKVGSEATIRMYVNARRTGGDDDRIRFRLRRSGGGIASSIVGDEIILGLTTAPSMTVYEWIDVGLPADGEYHYSLECSRDVGGGLFYSAKLIADAGKR